MQLIKFLKQIALFEGFNHNELQKLSKLFIERTLDKGATVCTRGEPGDSMFLIYSGEMEVWTGDQDNKLINRLGAGDIFGEIAMLLEGKRISTVIVTRRAKLFELKRIDIEENFLQDPQKLKSLYSIIARRLTQANRSKIPTPLMTVISVIGPGQLKGKTMLANALSALLEKFTTTPSLIIRLHLRDKKNTGKDGGILYEKISWNSKSLIVNHIRNKSHHQDVLDISFGPSVTQKKMQNCLCRVFENIRGIYKFVVIDQAIDIKPVARAVIDESDIVINFQLSDDIEFIPVNRSQKVYRVINQYNAGSAMVPISGMDPFILQKDPDIENMSSDLLLDYICTNLTTKISRPIHRLARKILGSTVGIALGGGAAFGIAHIGVLKFLDDHNIPVDLVSGTSMGSAVAVGYASGLTGNDMIEMAQKIGNIWNTLSAARDITLFNSGILGGKGLKKALNPFLNGNTTFQDLLIPCRTVATDIEDGTRVSIASGRLDEAIRCSASVPLVWSPVKYRNRILVDGAINDPVPAEVVREMGADICIAVNVVPPLKKGTQTILSKIYKRANRFNPISMIGNRQKLPNIFDIIMNSIQTLQCELGNLKAASADVLINPDLSEFTWVEFYKPMAFIDKGTAAAEPAIPKITKLLSEKMAAYSFTI